MRAAAATTTDDAAGNTDDVTAQTVYTLYSDELNAGSGALRERTSMRVSDERLAILTHTVQY
jgi:hypothetical protein